MTIENILFYNHEIVDAAPQNYCEISIAPDKILKAWSQSLNCYDFLDKNGQVKTEGEMNPDILKKYLDIKDSMKRCEKISKPVIGVGIMDTIEIGIGREIIVAATVLNATLIQVHMRKAQEADVRKLLKL